MFVFGVFYDGEFSFLWSKSLCTLLGSHVGKCLSPGCTIPEKQAICTPQPCDQAELLVLCVCAGMCSLVAGVVLSVFRGPICPTALCLQSILNTVWANVLPTLGFLTSVALTGCGAPLLCLAFPTKTLTCFTPAQASW